MLTDRILIAAITSGVITAVIMCVALAIALIHRSERRAK